MLEVIGDCGTILLVSTELDVVFGGDICIGDEVSGIAGPGVPLPLSLISLICNLLIDSSDEFNEYPRSSSSSSSRDPPAPSVVPSDGVALLHDGDRGYSVPFFVLGANFP